jgi:hypothetical protein
MNGSLETVIATLTRRLRDTERRANELIGASKELRETINLLCAQAGLPPRFPTGGGGGDDEGSEIASEASGEPLPATGGRAIRIAADSFFGKRQATAIRELLEMRRASSEGPARPREIYDALRAGGYAFKAKDDETALVSLRALLRKNPVFLRVPGTSGAYGLRAWYPHAAKSTKVGGGDADADAKPDAQAKVAEQSTDATEMKENAA